MFGLALIIIRKMNNYKSKFVEHVILFPMCRGDKSYKTVTFYSILFFWITTRSMIDYVLGRELRVPVYPERTSTVFGFL